MAEESDLEKTEQPSQRRLDQAREKGQVARSRELSTFAVLLAGGGTLWLMGDGLNRHMIDWLKNSLTFNRDVVFNAQQMIPRLFEFSVEALWYFSPVLLALLVAAVFSPMLINGWLFSSEALAPQFSRLNPLSGIGRMFSLQSVIELLKALAKSILIGGIAALVIWQDREAALQLSKQLPEVAIPELASLVTSGVMTVIAAVLLIVLIDVPYQLWEHNRKLKMTKEEVRQEAKETEGDPMVKGRIRSLQREAARRRMMAAIPTADVVVTNPTHYSVALKYSEDGMRAPVVVAKGSHLLALKIREIAKENNVPILEAPPLARALHKHTELGQVIPEALYAAVAEVLAYVYQLKRYQKQGGNYPAEPANLLVPAGMDPGVPPDEKIEN